MAHIVVGYDGSACARAALRTAVEVGKALVDEVCVVLSYEVNRVGGEMQDYLAALGERAQTLSAEAHDQAAALGFAVATEIVKGAPADALIDVSDRLDARVIVVGSRGESPLKGALVGSTPHKLLQVAMRPVLVVPQPL